MTTDKQSIQVLASRRKLVKTLTAAGGAVAVIAAIPEKWTRPVVQSIFLPVHARTSLPNLRIGGRLGNGVTDTGSDPKKGILDYFIDTATAQSSILDGSCGFVDIPGGGVGRFEIILPDGSTIFGDARSDGNILLGSGSGLTMHGTHISAFVVTGAFNNGSVNFPFTFDESGFSNCTGGGGGPIATLPPGGQPTSTPHYTATPTSTSVPPTPTSTSVPPTVTPTATST